MSDADEWERQIDSYQRRAQRAEGSDPQTLPPPPPPPSKMASPMPATFNGMNGGILKSPIVTGNVRPRPTPPPPVLQHNSSGISQSTSAPNVNQLGFALPGLSTAMSPLKPLRQDSTPLSPAVVNTPSSNQRARLNGSSSNNTQSALFNNVPASPPPPPPPIAEEEPPSLMASSNSFGNSATNHHGSGYSLEYGESVISTYHQHSDSRNGDPDDDVTPSVITSSLGKDLDEEKTDGDDEGWEEYMDIHRNKLYYNTRTGAIQFQKPDNMKEIRRMPASHQQVDEESDDDEEDDRPRSSFNTLNDDVTSPVDYKRARRNSSILEDAWQEETKERNKGRVRGSTMGEEDDAYEGRGMSIQKIVKSLLIVEKQVNLILSHSQNLNTNIVDDLRTIRQKVESVSRALEQGENALDTRSDVDALTDVDKLQWNWKNRSVDYFRAAAINIPHHEFEFKDWHCPQYFSNFPLPPGVKSCTAVIKLPVIAESESTSQLLTHTRINVEAHHTVAHCIHLALQKCNALRSGENENDYVLKSSGLHDYMTGDRPLMEYEYVRHCMREGNEVKLSLIRRPAVLPPIPNQKDYSTEYSAKVNKDVSALRLEDYRLPSSRNWNEMTYIQMNDISLPFRCKLIGVDNLTDISVPRVENINSFYIRTFLFHGIQKLPESMRETEVMPICSEPRYNQSFVYKELSLNQLPRGLRQAWILIGKTTEKEYMIAWCSIQLIDEYGVLVAGKKDCRLWTLPAKKKGKHKVRDPDPDFIYRATTRDNWSGNMVATLHLQFDAFALPVVSPITEKYREPNPRVVGPETQLNSLSKAQKSLYEELLDSDPLYPLAPEDKQLLWQMRHSLTKFPQMLPKFLQCVIWGNPDYKFEAHRLLRLWSPPYAPVNAIELLDARYPDYMVREYAVNQLRRLPDDELRLYLLQFVQCLKYEPYHDSPLCRFIVERALRSPMTIGHFLFWHLKAELHNPHWVERFYLILEEVLSFGGRMTHELRKQNSAVLKMQRVAEMIVRLKREDNYPDNEAMKEYTKEIEKLNTDFFLPMGKFQIPFNPRLEATTLIVEKCRYMSSKMVPLWLVFHNSDSDSPPIYLIFKSGDDLRQDILTLQILQIMDKIWLSSGLDLKMKPYRCVATGINEEKKGVGMVEVVTNSDTTSGIQLKYGGGAMGALRDDPIDLFLKDYNKGKALYEKAVDNFVCSCAGYCVATFILGVGDRHNGNIMVTRDGHLFHIDFGHFLGNFKKKFGVNRERAAFVFTPEMAFVMGGKNYKSSKEFKKFLSCATNAFTALRKNAQLFEVLFILMVAAGMPELMKEADIHYMREKLCLTDKQKIADKKAEKKFEEEIEKSLKTTYRRIDNLIHNMKHG